MIPYEYCISRNNLNKVLIKSEYCDFNSNSTSLLMASYKLLRIIFEPPMMFHDIRDMNRPYSKTTWRTNRVKCYTEKCSQILTIELSCAASSRTAHYCGEGAYAKIHRLTTI